MSQVVTETMVRVEDVRKSYGHGGAAVHALRGVSFEVPRGELVALEGRSGSGKTTLLNVVGGLDAPDAGRVEVDGRSRIGTPTFSAAVRIGISPKDWKTKPTRSRRRANRPSSSSSASLRRTAPREREERVAPSSATPSSGPASCPAASSSASPSPALANHPALLIADGPTGQLEPRPGTR